MTQTQKVTVVIPAHNEEHYIARCLKALERQTVDKQLFNVVVVDNASTDRTAAIAKAHNVKVIHQPIKGYTCTISAGFNYAIKEGASWILVTDADSEVAPGWIKEVLYHINRAEGTDIVGFTGPVTFYDASHFTNVVTDMGYRFYVSACKVVGKFVPFTGQNCAFNVAAYKAVNGIKSDYLISPDVDLSKRLCKHGRILFLGRMRVQVSSRRFRKAPVKALYQYTRGAFAVLRGKASKVELDDIR